MLKFLLTDRLNDMNRERKKNDQSPLTWEDVATEIGVSRQMLATLAGNTSLIATSTRVVEGACRFFKCGPERILELYPDPDQPYPTRIQELYSSEERRRFRDPRIRESMGLPPIRRIRRRR